MSAVMPLNPPEVPLPVEYEAAVTAIAACRSLDETRYWSNKADLFAVWARIHKSREAELQAKRLKLHASRRLGELAAELRPSVVKYTSPQHHGRLPGPVSLLMEYGLSRGDATAARMLARISREVFEELLETPFAPATAVGHVIKTGDPVWRQFLRGAVCLRAFLRQRSAKELVELARSLGGPQEQKLQGLASELLERLGEIERLMRCER